MSRFWSIPPSKINIILQNAFSFIIATGIIMSTVELVNQTPVVTNVSLVVDNATTPFSTYSCDYVFNDAQNGTPIAWFVNGSYAGNSTNDSIVHTGGISLMCAVTPYDAVYWGVAVESESQLILATEE
jgi:hypothetical protein